MKKRPVPSLAAISLLLFLLLQGCTLGARLPSQPEIVVEPAGGGPFQAVTVRGSHFPPDADVSIRLGPPDVGAAPHAYSLARSDGAGGFTASFRIPQFWPDGRLILEQELLIIALNEDGSVRATAPFTYRPAARAAPTL